MAQIVKENQCCGRGCADCEIIEMPVAYGYAEAQPEQKPRYEPEEDDLDI